MREIIFGVSFENLKEKRSETIYESQDLEECRKILFDNKRRTHKAGWCITIFERLADGRVMALGEVK